MKLALLNEILGRSECAPIVFGSQAPDSGNSEILAHYGTPELKERYLKPLLENTIISCFSMTEPQGGADPKVFTTTAVQDGDDWIINGEKWYSSFASMASFIIVMAMTDPEAPPYERYSMFVLPGDTPGINVLRDVGLGYQPLGGGGREGYVRYENVRVPNDHMLGPRGGAFVVAQTRLGGGRIHHAMRTVGLVRRIYDMICERAVSRYTQGEVLANKQMVQEMIADSWMEIEAFRLLTLQTAWKIDKYNDYKAVRADISAVKAMMQKVLHDVSARALQIHGSLGTSHEMPFVQYLTESFVLGLADGPTEVHKVTLARLLLKDVEAGTRHVSLRTPAAAARGRRGEVRRQAGRHPARLVECDRRKYACSRPHSTFAYNNRTFDVGLLRQQRPSPLQQAGQHGCHRLQFGPRSTSSAIVLDDQPPRRRRLEARQRHEPRHVGHVGPERPAVAGGQLRHRRHDARIRRGPDGRCRGRR